MAKKAKKKDQQPEICVLCTVMRVEARLDQVNDAIDDALKIVRGPSSVEAYIGARQARFWWSDVMTSVKQQVEHTCG